MGTAILTRPLKRESEVDDEPLTEREQAERVYRKYGTDLDAFYRDAAKSIVLEKSERRKSRKSGSAA